MLVPLGGVAALLAGYLQPAAHAATTPTGLAVLAAAALGCVLCCLLAQTTPLAPAVAVPLHRRSTALRAKALHTAFLRLRDPDAAGRPRPRAPSANPAAA